MFNKFESASSGKEQLADNKLKSFLALMGIVTVLSFANVAEAKELKESAELNQIPKVSIFQAVAGSETTNEISDSKFLNSLSNNKEYQAIKDKILSAKMNLGEHGLYLEHGGLFYNPKKDEAKNFGFGLNKKGFEAEFENKSKNEEALVKIGKNNSIQFTKKF